MNGRSSWMLLSFKFLIACTVGVELLISDENLFVNFYFNGVVFSSRFSKRAERRANNHLCWFSDENDQLVFVSLYFTLHLYFGNAAIVPFFKQSARCWRSFDWSYNIWLGLFPERMSIYYAITKTLQSVVPTCFWHVDSWYCGTCLERKTFLFVAES